MSETDRLEAGLHMVSTPIGAARDITLRALDVLRAADVLAAEDTRTTRKLLEIHGIPLNGRPLIPYHDHNGPAQRPKILARIAEGKSVAYTSDAGTPLVADPGFQLARAVAEAGFPVRAVPGASAVLAALVSAALPTDRFLFAGFAPPAEAARRRTLEELAHVPATLVFYETGRRCLPFLRSAMAVLGADRQGAICRELTKKFEEVRRGSLADLADGIDAAGLKGEVVVLIDRERGQPGAAQMEARLTQAMEQMTVKDAARTVAEELGLPRRDVYQAALALRSGAADAGEDG